MKAAGLGLGPRALLRYDRAVDTYRTPYLESLQVGAPVGWKAYLRCRVPDSIQAWSPFPTASRPNLEAFVFRRPEAEDTAEMKF